MAKQYNEMIMAWWYWRNGVLINVAMINEEMILMAILMTNESVTIKY